MDLLTPKYLTKKMAQEAVKLAVNTVLGTLPVKRQHCHVVVLVPALTVSKVMPYPKNYGLEYELLHEESFKDGTDWAHDYEEIAQCKAIQLIHARNLGGSQLATPVHLLYPGDTPFWGGDVIEDIVVTCSGVQPHFDKLISRIAASTMIAMAKEAWENSKDKELDRDFLLEGEEPDVPKIEAGPWPFSD